MKRFNELTTKLRKSLDALVAAEAGWLAYCEDTEDGCNDEWHRLLGEFKEDSGRFIAFCENPGDGQ